MVTVAIAVQSLLKHNEDIGANSKDEQLCNIFIKRQQRNLFMLIT